MNGYVVEFCIYVEDFMDNFLLSIGILIRYCLLEGEGICLDSGYEEGMEIFIYYDLMIVKLVIYVEDCLVVIQKMKEVIDVFELEGIVLMFFFGRFVMEYEVFISGKFDMYFVKYYFQVENIKESQKEEVLVVVVLVV